MIPDYVYWGLAIFVGFPIFLYLCVKLATVAYYRGKNQAKRLERAIDDPIIPNQPTKRKDQHGSAD